MSSESDVLTVSGPPPDSDKIYELHTGLNLISFPVSGSVSIPDGIDDSIESEIQFVIGESRATAQLEGEWVGSLTEVAHDKGYWLSVTDNTQLNVTGFPGEGENQLYTLHTGANLISYPYEDLNAIGAAIPDLFEGYIEGVISEGVAAAQTAPGNWVGSQCSFMVGKGYWVLSQEEIDFSFERDKLNSLLKRLSPHYKLLNTNKNRFVEYSSLYFDIHRYI